MRRASSVWFTPIRFIRKRILRKNRDPTLSTAPNQTIPNQTIQQFTIRFAPVAYAAEYATDEELSKEALISPHIVNYSVNSCQLPGVASASTADRMNMV